MIKLPEQLKKPRKNHFGLEPKTCREFKIEDGESLELNGQKETIDEIPHTLRWKRGKNPWNWKLKLIKPNLALEKDNCPFFHGYN